MRASNLPLTVLLLAAVLATSACATAPAQEAAPAWPEAPPLDATETRFAADFDRFLSASLARLPAVPAVSVSVARSDGPIYTKAFGRADIENAVPATPETRFYIASSTKSFVALALRRLEERGEIDLDWTLAELAPDVRFAPEVRAHEVTLRRLLSHSHGLTNPGMEFRLAYSGEHDPQTLWGMLASTGANTEAPLGTFHYGNVGYNVAALLLERRLGRRWQDILEAEVLRPLALTHTLAQGTQAARRTHPFAAPYFSADPAGVRRMYLLKVDSNMQSAGGMFSSARDLGTWVALQLAAQKGEAGLPIPAPIAASTHLPVVSLDAAFGPFTRKAYGLGWYSGPYQGADLFHAFGAYVGARAHVSFMPSRDVGVAVVTNDEGAGFQFIDLAAAYAYDWFAVGPEAAALRGEQAVTKLADDTVQRTARLAAGAAQRAGRAWRLTLPREAYRGRYCSPEYGTMEVADEGGGMLIKVGLLRALAEPFTEPDSARVELIGNNGAPLQFVTAGDRVAAVKGLGGTFTRC